MNNSHTKTPWTGMDKNGNYYLDSQWSADHEDAAYCSSAPIHSGGKVVALVVSTRSTDDELHANAEFIVRACNAHDELVALLREVVEADEEAMEGLKIIGIPTDFEDACMPLISKCKALLSKIDADSATKS